MNVSSDWRGVEQTPSIYIIVDNLNCFVLGDFAILLSTGLSWYAALGFNFVSSLTAVVGFFVGVAVGVATSEANGWILAAAAGVFLYIALVDLVSRKMTRNELTRSIYFGWFI